MYPQGGLDTIVGMASQLDEILIVKETLTGLPPIFGKVDWCHARGAGETSYNGKLSTTEELKDGNPSIYQDGVQMNLQGNLFVDTREDHGDARGDHDQGPDKDEKIVVTETFVFTDPVTVQLRGTIEYQLFFLMS